jgi:hypothetical protein
MVVSSMRYKPGQNVAPFRRVSAALFNLSPVCLLLCLHVMGSLSPGQNIRGGPNAADEKRGEEIKRKLLAPAFKMLKTKGVPFDPALLLGEDWRSRIEPALARMPEMDQTLRVTEPMEGVYLAGIVLLPEHVRIRGDTLILTRELAPDDENSAINITGGHRLFIFNIGDNRKFEAMVRNRPRDQSLNIDVDAPCALVGIAPMYLGTYRCVGMGYVGGWKRRT